MRWWPAAGYDSRRLLTAAVPVAGILATLLAACAPAAAPVAVAVVPDVPDVPDVPAPVAPPAPRDAERHYTVWLGGAQIGAVTEREWWTADGVVLQRGERMRFLRGDTAVALDTEIEIAADRALQPQRVAWRETGGRSGGRHGSALRGADGWTVTADGAPATLPAGAVPAELIPLVVRRDGGFHGVVFLPARGFVVGRGQVAAVAPDRLVARLVLDNGAIAESTIDVDAERDPARIVDGDGVIAMRASPAAAAAAYEPVDLIGATAVPIAGAPARDRRLLLTGDVALPPLPGQAAHATAHGVELALSPRLSGELPAGAPGPDRTRDIRRLIREVRARIVPDLGAGPTAAAAATAAVAGDCTTYALAYAAQATRHAIPTRVVTGLRVDGRRLVRHRWAVSWTGRAWIAIDAAFDAAPAGGDLIGLAVHDADDAGLVAGEAALTGVRAAAWR